MLLVGFDTNICFARLVLLGYRSVIFAISEIQLATMTSKLKYFESIHGIYDNDW